jgi:hypothetical protein
MEWEELKLGILALRRLGYAKIEAVQEGDAIYSVVHLTSTLLTLWKAITDR